MLFFASSVYGIPPNTPITNVATVAYQVAGQGYSVSASDTVITDATGGGGGRNSSLGFAVHAPGVSGARSTFVGQGQCGASGDNSGPFTDVATPVDLAGNTIAVPGLVDLSTTPAFKTGDVLFVELSDPDANLDVAGVDAVLVRISLSNGDAELLRMAETGASTGVFVGYLSITSAPVTAYDCALSGGAAVDIDGRYVDAGDPGDVTTARAFVDPFGLVFDSGSGRPVDGAVITIIDVLTGMPAAVLGDDGISAYPATVTSGAGAVDGSGTNYVFAEGQYRFPFLEPGEYRLEVTPPNRFSFPSAAADGVLQGLPGAPFVLSDASRGQRFAVPVGPAVRIDVPLDPTPATPTPAELTLLRLAPAGELGYVGSTQCFDGVTDNPAPPPTSGGNVLTVPGEFELSPTTILTRGEPFVVRLVDPDQDRDPFAPDLVVVDVTVDGLTMDAERLTLSETGASTGEFVGYLQTSAASAAEHDCVVSSAAGERVLVSYVDAFDEADIASAWLSLDPGGVVFDSDTGAAVDGARVTLINTSNGKPAVGKVFAEDGVTPFPASVTSGEDGLAGGYRFPVVTPGSYQLRVEPPLGFTFPSDAADAELNALPGGPFRLRVGSRGGELAIGPGESLTLDLPLDVLDVDLFVVKRASKEQAAIGDFVQFQVTVENATAGGVATDLVLVDRLPKGFRYAPGSTRINGEPGADPSIGRDGRTLHFPLADLTAADSAEVSYVTEITSGAELGDAVNEAQARGLDGAVSPLSSNVAIASVTIREELLFSKATLIGQVTSGPCDGTPGTPVPGIRLFLEDGTYVVTDTSGKYHIEGLEPGTHVVQLDTGSIPASHEPAACDRDSRHAGSAISQFVDVAGGTLWRADFRLAERPPQVEKVTARLTSRVDGDGVALDYHLEAGAIALSEVTVVLMLPDQASVVPGSLSIDGVSVDDVQNGRQRTDPASG